MRTRVRVTLELPAAGDLPEVISRLQSWLARFGASVMTWEQVVDPDPDEERGPAIPTERGE